MNLTIIDIVAIALVVELWRSVVALFIRIVLDNPKPKKKDGFTYFDEPGCCYFCGRRTCKEECFR
jgi:hypothetical protein